VTDGPRRSVLGARRPTGLRASAAAALLLFVLAAGSARAQQGFGFQPEGRVDLFFANGTTVQGGGGGAWTLGRNARLVALGGAGSTFSDGRGMFSARLDVLGRFVLDPDRVDRWALYGTGGLSVRYEALPSWRGALVALIGIEGPKWGSVTPFVEAGYGGGFQIGFGVRRALSHGR
jgi:hypothetical protein